MVLTTAALPRHTGVPRSCSPHPPPSPAPQSLASLEGELVWEVRHSQLVLASCEFLSHTPPVRARDPKFSETLPLDPADPVPRHSHRQAARLAAVRCSAIQGEGSWALRMPREGSGKGWVLLILLLMPRKGQEAALLMGEGLSRSQDGATWAQPVPSTNH